MVGDSWWGIAYAERMWKISKASKKSQRGYLNQAKIQIAA